MPDSPFAEKLLARATDPTRAAAIYGDLLELASTRGRLWFLAAYARTLLSLTWRTPVALLGAVATVSFMFGTISPWLFQHVTRHLSDGWQVNMAFAQAAMAIAPLLHAAAMCLWFALPYALLRFGWRDRLTQLACAISLVTFPVYSYRPWVIDLFGVVAALTILAALFSPLWRKPMVVLVLTSAAAIASVSGCFRLLAIVHGRSFNNFTPNSLLGWLTTTVALSVAAFVCSRLHRRLLEPPAPEMSTAAT